MTKLRAFTNIYAGRSYRLLSNAGVSEADKPFPQNKAKLPWLGLWDTGASNSVITQKIVDALGLIPDDRVVVSTPSGIMETFLYTVDICLPNDIVIQHLSVPLGHMATSDLLIGMDIISQGDFAVSNVDGKTAFTYRVPSLVRFDFEKDSYLA
jgi:hypothetical protein